MKRREAIKNIGMSLGFVVATPSVLSLLQSCKSDPKIDWTPEFFSPEEGQVIKKLVSLILPATDKLPGATEVNIPEFIDKYLALVAGEDEKDKFKNGVSAISEVLGKSINKVSDSKINDLLANYLGADKDNTEYKNDVISQALHDIRGKTIWGYRNSQKVGMEVLAYDPVPGTYNGCMSLEEATGGLLWSLT